MMGKKEISRSKKIGRWIGYSILGLILILLFNRFIILDGRYEDVRKPGEAINPTSYVFDFPRKMVIGVLDSSFNDQFRSDELEWRGFGRYSKKHVRGLSLFHLGAKRDKGIEICTFSAGSLDQSYVYRKKKTKAWLSMSFTFMLEITSLGANQTKVEVIYQRSSSMAGCYLAFNPHSMDFMVPRFLDLGSTTIEEYEILRYLGKMLGQQGMPPIRYPGAVNLLDVRANFIIHGQQTLPFTEDEMVFGE